MLISFDFWGTLYNHSGTKESRMAVVHNLINNYFLQNNIPYNNNVNDIFTITDKYIKHCHSQNTFPSDEIIGEYISKQYDFIFDKYFFIELKKQIENLYINTIKPIPIKGVREFLRNATRNHKLCITSDTFFIRGKTIRKILQMDGLLECFDSFFFSDEMGYNKTNHTGLITLIKQDNYNKKDVVHIGDSLGSDRIYAMNLRVQFIHYLSDLGSISPHKYFFNSYSELDSILNSITHDSTD